MVFAHTTLPYLNTLDAESLKEPILSQHEQLLSRDHEIEHITLLIGELRRMQFGRKSEKVERQIEQLELQLEDLAANRAESVPLTAKRTATSNTIPPATKPSRRAASRSSSMRD